MPVYRVEFVAKGYIEVSRPDESSASEVAEDLVAGMTPRTFHATFSDEVELNKVELAEEDVNSHDRQIDLNYG